MTPDLFKLNTSIIKSLIFQIVVRLYALWHISCFYKSKEMTKQASSPVRARRYPAECHPNLKRWVAARKREVARNDPVRPVSSR